MTSSEPNTETQRAAPRPLWRAMRAFLCLLFDLFGQPGDIAACGLLGRSNRALLMPWLRAGEAFLRRLLFIEALALANDARAHPTPKAKRAARGRVRRLHEVLPDKPEDWRVTFRLLPGARPAPGRRSGGRRRMRRAAPALPPALLPPRPRPAHFPYAHALVVRPTTHSPPGTPRAPRDMDNAWPIAERLEAMLRAYNAPHASALRLARILLRDAQRAARALRPLPAHSVHLFGAEIFARCNAIVASRRRRRERARMQRNE